MWYNSSLFSALMGAMVTIIIFIITNIINNRKERKSNVKSFLTLLMQQYSMLFSAIYQGSINPEKIDYKLLRNELKKSMAIVFLLPENIQMNFSKLLNIYFTNEKYYDDHKSDIENILKDIVKALQSYGVDIFGI
ncbi:hypothetical protein ACJDT4_12430 [Clostridium neuense]|uniref:Uncharacterized protein n=1 Tax=Clostridium neuense TaxID=1728934 RepID=A0ABW8TJV5_9CLOT